MRILIKKIRRTGDTESLGWSAKTEIIALGNQPTLPKPKRTSKHKKIPQARRKKYIKNLRLEIFAIHSLFGSLQTMRFQVQWHQHTHTHTQTVGHCDL